MSRFIEVSVLFGIDKKEECVGTVRPRLELNLDKVGDKTLDEVYKILKDLVSDGEMFEDAAVRDATAEELREDAEED